MKFHDRFHLTDMPMRFFPLLGLLLVLMSVLSVAEAQAQKVARPTGTKKAANGYHRTSNTKAKARSGAYARYDRSGRRNEDDMKLAPGLRLNMPSPPPPTTWAGH